MMSIVNATSVFLYSLGIGSLFHITSMLDEVSSGSVRIPTIGSTLSGILWRTFSFGFTGAGMSAKIDLIFASTWSTSTSPTTMTA